MKGKHIIGGITMKKLYAVYGNNIDMNTLQDYSPRAYEGLDGQTVYIVKATIIEAIKLTAKMSIRNATVTAF
jgi:hypothetical protein